MKKIGLIFAALLVCGSLTACGSQSTKAKNSSSEISSLKKENSQLKHKHHKKQNKKKQSSSSSASSNNSQNVQQQRNVTQSTPQQGQASQQNNQQVNSDPTQSGDIHSFVNQYGVSPALYKMQHYGMSQQQALDSTPDNMKTSGELQTQHLMEGQ